MNIRIVSDLHLEFGSPETFSLSKGDEDSNTVLVLAGDILLGKKIHLYDDFLLEISDRFQDVIYVLGNHEFYGGSIITVGNKIRDHLKGLDITNIHVLENQSILIDDVCFIGSTMWSSYERQNPVVMMEAQLKMTDHKKIRTGTVSSPYARKFLPLEAYQMFLESINYIFPTIECEKKWKNRKVCVVTHHGCSYQSVADIFKGQCLNGAYVSELYEDIIETQPDIWIHGHTHKSLDYMIESTRVICNPRGYYPKELNPEFNDQFIISL